MTVKVTKTNQATLETETKVYKDIISIHNGTSYSVNHDKPRKFIQLDYDENMTTQHITIYQEEEIETNISIYFNK